MTAFVTVCLRRCVTKGFVAIVVVVPVIAIVVNVVRRLFELLLLVLRSFE